LVIQSPFLWCLFSCDITKDGTHINKEDSLSSYELQI
jgi:hypothetical protein